MPTLSPADVRRRRRFALLEFVRGITERTGGKNCMHALGSTMNAGSTAAGVVHTSGVQRCASSWSCPVCSPKLAESRAGEVDQGVSRHLAGGGLAYFVTSTARHKAGTHLVDVLDLVQLAYRSTMQSRWAKRKLERRSTVDGVVVDRWFVPGPAALVGYVGQIRAVEITHGKNGWHPHVHTVFLFDGSAPAEECEAWLFELGLVWSKQLERRGGSCGDRGWDVRPVVDSEGIANYLTKIESGWGVGLELAGANRKTSKGTTPWAFLDKAEGGDQYALMMWKIYETATLGRQSLRWSQGLKAKLGVDELDDDELLEVTPDEPMVVEAIVPGGQWKRLLAIGEAADLLGALADIATQRASADSWRWPSKWLYVGGLRTTPSAPGGPAPSP